MTLLDALQYLSLFANKRTKAYKCTKKQRSAEKVYKSIKKQPKQGIKGAFKYLPKKDSMMVVVAMRAPSMPCKKTLVMIKKELTRARDSSNASRAQLSSLGAKTIRMRLGLFPSSPPSLSLPVDK